MISRTIVLRCDTVDSENKKRYTSISDHFTAVQFFDHNEFVGFYSYMVDELRQRAFCKGFEGFIKPKPSRRGVVIYMTKEQFELCQAEFDGIDVSLDIYRSGEEDEEEEI